jgi:hypothetical protein
MTDVLNWDRHGVADPGQLRMYTGVPGVGTSV